MKVLKKILLGFLVLFVVSSIAGYFYFDRKFTPAENYLTVSGTSQSTITWSATKTNPHAALLLPIKIKGVDRQFYMQLDFGSPITLFYKKSLESIQSQSPTPAFALKNNDSISLSFDLSGMRVSSTKFRMINYGQPADLNDGKAINIIGTIGTDLLEQRTVVLDFKAETCTFQNHGRNIGFSEFEFKKRKILLPATLNGKSVKLMYDSGASGYQLITDHNQWQELKTAKTAVKSESGNSWGKSLSIFTASADSQITFAGTPLKLLEVTYIDGTSQIQNLLMTLSGMQGMIGNKIFLGHKITLDCKNEKFKVE